jgi:3D (Asp-Asp-Asp) domain-containing protein
MRRNRSLSSSERWELGLFLVMLGTGFLCLTVILKAAGLPKLFAFAGSSAGTATQTTAPTAAAPAAPVTNLTPATPSALQFVTPAPAPEPAPQPGAPKADPAPKKPSPEYKWYNGEKYKYVKTLRLRVTAYAPDARCCWPYDGTTTASGLSVKTNRGHLVAADTRLIPMHSLVCVPGYHDAAAVPVLDRGGAIKGHRLDVLLPTFEQAKAWGSRILEVKIYEPVD